MFLYHLETTNIFYGSQVVHVVDTTERVGEKPDSFVSLFSITPGKLTKEIDQIKEGFVCGRHKVVDFVTFSVKYGCLTFDETEGGWNESDIPTIDVVNDRNEDKRVTHVAIDTKRSIRWFLAINAEEIEDFMFKGIIKFSHVFNSSCIIIGIFFFFLSFPI